MNEESTPPLPSDIPPALPTYKDRSTGLFILGLLTLLMGFLAALLVPLMWLGQMAAAKAPNAPAANVTTILPVALIYGGLAVVLIWLGIGSMMARRWARALLLIFSWAWLIMGIFMTAIIPFVTSKTLANLPPNAQTGQPALPPGALTGMIVGMSIFFGIFFVLLPAIWVFFYKSPHVKATCEARDPEARWTDACPLPVLAMSLWSCSAVPIMVLMPLTGHGVMPFFGTFLSGLPGSLFCLVIASIWGVSAWWLYRLDLRGWWLIFIAVAVFMASALITYTHHDIIEMYQRMGYPQAQIDLIQKTGFLTSNHFAWMTCLASLPFLGYLLFVKKYFPQK